MPSKSVVPVKYVGCKELKNDNVAGTGLSWKRGQVHLVPVGQAALLIRHPTVWELADKADAGAVPAADVRADDGQLEDVDTVLPNMNEMSRDGVIALAETRFGIRLDANVTKAHAMALIVDLQNASEVSAKLEASGRVRSASAEVEALASDPVRPPAAPVEEDPLRYEGHIEEPVGLPTAPK